MTAYILIKAVDGWNPSDPMVWMTGYIVQVMPTNQIGGKQIPPKFCQFEITDETPENLQVYCDMWRREIDWEFVGHDYAIDGHRLRVFVKPELLSASGLNSLTREIVETFLNRWGAIVQSIAANEVVFDCTVLNAIKSEGFWNRATSATVFTETAYDQSTGVHRVRATYTAVPELVALPDAEINSYIEQRGGTIVQHVANQRVTFDIGRDSVFNVFKLDVKDRVDKNFARRRWTFTQAGVALAIANGGSIAMTRQEALAYVHNRLLD